MTQPLLGHQPALDGLRGLAILLVMLFHTHVLGVGSMLRGGFVGVDVFFVLSGFLITTLLIERHGERLTSFYRRRVVRLLPAALVAVLITLLVSATFSLDGTDVSGALLALSYGFNWFMAGDDTSPPALEHFWSLAIEEQFYVVWPLVVAGAVNRRLSRRTMLLGVAAAICAVVLWRAWLYQAGVEAASLYFRTDTRLDGLLTGAALAIARPLTTRWPGYLVGSAASVALGVLVSVVVLWPIGAPAMYLGGFFLVALCSAVVILAALDGRWVVTPLLRSGMLKVVGRYSYSLYLWHMPVYFAVGHAALPATMKVVVAVSGTALFAWASHRYVEKPFLTWGTSRMRRPIPLKEAEVAAV